eukprot:Phypoly_transcript_07741.p1 GENE.Phypoly_transcript_07741~~Phypoly_transcript_07741.p1  ORF type:complete len:320 (+),score=55.99 Phypoly_transcript_07741:628-1587(+)
MYSSPSQQNLPQSSSQNFPQNPSQNSQHNLYNSHSQNGSFSNHPPQNQDFSENQQNVYSSPDTQYPQNQPLYNQQSITNQQSFSQNMTNQGNQQQNPNKNNLIFTHPHPPAFSSENANWAQIAEQLAKLTETQIQFMNKMDNFMFETRKELSTINQRMSDLEGVVEILYHTHQERSKEDKFDPLDTPHPPSAEPFDAALGYLGIGHVKAAYEKVVKSGDNLQLARLMQKTGPVIDKLDTPILVELFTRITQFLKTKAFLDTVFPWLWQSINLSNLPLDPPLLSPLMSALEDISVDPSKNGIEAAQILAQLKKLGLVWGQ